MKRSGAVMIDIIVSMVHQTSILVEPTLGTSMINVSLDNSITSAIINNNEDNNVRTIKLKIAIQQTSDGRVLYYRLKDQFHRVHQAAMIYSFERTWCRHNTYHRLNGPAGSYDQSEINDSWWIDDQCFSHQIKT